MDVNLEAEPFAELGKLSDAGMGAVAEAEVAALVYSADLQALHEDAADEALRGEAGERRIKRQNQHVVNTGFSKQTEPLGHGRQQPGGLVGAEQQLRMRIEGYGNGAGL